MTGTCVSFTCYSHHGDTTVSDWVVDYVPHCTALMCVGRFDLVSFHHHQHFFCSYSYSTSFFFQYRKLNFAPFDRRSIANIESANCWNCSQPRMRGQMARDASKLISTKAIILIYMFFLLYVLYGILSLFQPIDNGSGLMFVSQLSSALLKFMPSSVTLRAKGLMFDVIMKNRSKHKRHEQQNHCSANRYKLSLSLSLSISFFRSYLPWLLCTITVFAGPWLESNKFVVFLSSGVVFGLNF